jgi:tetratricopeptide (TPR) repeat protein
MKKMIGVAVVMSLLASCAVLGPPQPQTPESTPANPQARGTSQAPGSARPGSQTPPAGAPAPAPPAPQQRQFALGTAAASLVGAAHAQEQSRDYGVAAETLERALSIEPHNPLVWIELGRENILSGNPAQAYGMGRKALYLASGDPRAQASAWELIAASLRAQGRNDEAYAAEEKAVGLNPN